uniref:PIP49_C domain-containing protein n=1 Tax=Strongyloides papillosus TaxID=174720 RepID=A0A0N5BVC7_STREA
MRQLSKKRMPQYILTILMIVVLVLLITFYFSFKIAMKYGIKVTMDDGTLLQLKERGISDILKHHNYSIEQHVISCMNCIYVLNSDTHGCSRRMRCYENLEEILLKLYYNLCDCSLEMAFKAFRNIRSLNNLKKVVRFELTFAEQPIE